MLGTRAGVLHIGRRKPCFPSRASPQVLETRAFCLRRRQTAQLRRRACSAPALLLSGAPLLAQDDLWALLAALTAAAGLGAHAGKHTALGRALSGPVTAMLLAWLLAMCGVLPPPGPVLQSLQLACVTLATPLLLLGADLRIILGRTSRLSAAFAIGAVGTTLGCLAGYLLLAPELRPLGGSEGWKLAAALLAKNVGGGINYVAVAAATGLSPPSIAAGLVADNIAGLIYFPLVGWLGRGHKDSITEATVPVTKPVVLEDSLAALALACFITAVARAACPGGAALPAATAIAVAFATAFPAQLARAAPAGDALGALLLYLFFATAGASAGDPSRALAFAPLLAFIAIVYAVHLTFTIGVCRALGFSLPEALVASNANIGGPATAASLAEGMGWAALRGPGLLIGSLGNATATFLALSLGEHVLKWI